jgi:hypothetical protein
MTALRKITYGVPSGNDALTVLFGIACGRFAAAGIDLSIKVVFGGPEIAAAASKRICFLASGPVSTLMRSPRVRKVGC